MSDFAELFVSALLHGGDIKFFIQHPEVQDYLNHSSSDASLYALVDSHVRKYGKLPHPETLEKEWGLPLPKAKEPPEFYADLLRPAHVRKTLQAATVEAQPFMKDNPEKGLELLAKAVYALQDQTRGLAIMDLRESKDFLLKYLSSKWSGSGFVPLGWKTFDQMSGGLQGGDFIVFGGKTGLGKTILLLSRAFYLWATFNLKVLFFSMEMTLPSILERAAAMQARVPLDYMKHGLFPNLKVDFKKQLIDKLDQGAKAKNMFNFVDGNLAVTNDDLLRICNQLQPDLVVVDGAYLLGGTSYQRRYETIAESATFLKQKIATNRGIPVMASYQFNKEGAKTKKGEEAVVQDLAGSMEIGNLATVVLGLFQGDTPETIRKRKINVLKGRNGEVGQFYVNWDFVNMDFDEVGEEDDLLQIT